MSRLLAILFNLRNTVFHDLLALIFFVSYFRAEFLNNCSRIKNNRPVIIQYLIMTKPRKKHSMLKMGRIKEAMLKVLTIEE